MEIQKSKISLKFVFWLSKTEIRKLADKISNLRDIVASPPSDWSVERKREYFDWAAKVVDGVRGVHPELEALFDKIYSKRP